MFATALVNFGSATFASCCCCQVALGGARTGLVRGAVAASLVEVGIEQLFVASRLRHRAVSLSVAVCSDLLLRQNIAEVQQLVDKCHLFAGSLGRKLTTLVSAIITALPSTTTTNHTTTKHAAAMTSAHLCRWCCAEFIHSRTHTNPLAHD